MKVEGRYIKQTGGTGDFGVVKLEVEPGEPGSGFAFESAVKGGAVPKEFIPAVRERLRGGDPERACWRATRWSTSRCGCVDGQTHDVDSSERSFKIAASIGMKEALRKAKPVLLEPIMSVEVVTPEDFVGAVQGDLNSRRGNITGDRDAGQRAGSSRRTSRSRACSDT